MPVFVDIYVREQWLLPPDYNPETDRDQYRLAMHTLVQNLAGIVTRAVNANIGGARLIKPREVWVNLHLLSEQAENAHDVLVRINPGVGKAPCWIRYCLIALIPAWRKLRRARITIHVEEELQLMKSDNQLLGWPALTCVVAPTPMSGFKLDNTGRQTGRWGGVPAQAEAA